jgi:hypothetical protein
MEGEMKKSVVTATLVASASVVAAPSVAATLVDVENPAQGAEATEVSPAADANLQMRVSRDDFNRYAYFAQDKGPSWVNSPRGQFNRFQGDPQIRQKFNRQNVNPNIRQNVNPNIYRQMRPRTEMHTPSVAEAFARIKESLVLHERFEEGKKVDLA